MEDRNRRSHTFAIVGDTLREVESDKDLPPHWTIAISYAGEDRLKAEKLSDRLRDMGVHVFYDKFEKARLKGKDLRQFLHDVYGQNSQLCLVLISSHYARKAWTRYELEIMRKRQADEWKDFVLPVRLDDTEMPEPLSKTKALDLRNVSIDQIAQAVENKLKQWAFAP